MMFAPWDYKTAIAVVQDEPQFNNLLPQLRVRLAQAERAQEHLEDIAMFAEDLDRSDSSFINGYKLQNKLISAGWTPPGGLF